MEHHRQFYNVDIEKEDTHSVTGKSLQVRTEGETESISSKATYKYSIPQNEVKENYDFLEVLPKGIKEFILKTAKQIDGPEEIVFTSVLACTSVALGNAGKLEIKKGWVEKPILFIGDVAASSAGKSPATNCGLEPLYKIQKQKLKEFKQNNLEYENNLADYESERFKKSKDIPNDQRIPKPKKPILEQIIVQDTTVEALRNVLEFNLRGVLIHADEMSGWLAAMDQYKGGKGNDKQQFLQIYNGKTLIYNRGKEHTIIEDTFCSIVGGIQNKKLNKLINDDNESDGFAQRFLLNRPETDIIRNPLYSDVEGFEEASLHYDDIINEIYNIPLSTKMIEFYPEAKTTFNILAGGIKAQSRDPKNSDFWKSLYGKLNTYFPRLCIILHALKYASSLLNGIDRDFYRIDEQTVIDVHDVWLNYFIKQWDIVEVEQELTEDEKIADKLYKLGELSKLEDNFGNKYVATRDILQSKPFGKKGDNTVASLNFYLQRNPHVGCIIKTNHFSTKSVNYYQFRGRPQNNEV